MLSLFLNPFTMFAGAGLVLAPIVIHLINRWRYRRVRWAAMEFVLKSIKKNRRKLILKQILLLVLRCALVLLFGLLLARYIGSAIGLGQPRGTLHVVVLDDTASMTDGWREDGQAQSTFGKGKKAVISDIAAGAVEAGLPQAVEVVRMTRPAESYRIDRLNPQRVAELQSWLDGVQPTALHAPLIPALEAAKKFFEADPQSNRVLHVVSDFRAKDWNGATAEALSKAFAAASANQTGSVHLLDVAHPARSANRAAAIDHGNVGILDLQPETRIASRHMPVEFSVTLANFTPSSRKNVRVLFKVNGQVREDVSISVVEVPPGLTTATAIATFDRLGSNMVTATIEPDEAGLAVDDLRYSTVEIREKVPLLFVSSGDATGRSRQEADGFYLRALFLEAAKGFDVVERGPQELEQPNLDRFPTIYLLNLPRLTDKAKANLEEYVRGGGGVFIALGDQADSDFYNHWYGDGQGAFPMPVGRPSEPLTDAQRFDRMFDPALPPKAYPRGDAHAVLARIYADDRNREINTYLKFLFVDRYLPVPRTRWTPEPGRTEELFTLPNYRSIDDYKESTQRLLARLPVDDPKLAQFRDRLKEHQRRVREILVANRPLHALADGLDAMLADTGDPAAPGAIGLQAYWARPDNGELKKELQRFIETLRYGDPLLVAHTLGRGRMLVLTTSAGSAWNDWPSGPARPYWVMLMLEAQKYLSSQSVDANRTVGMPIMLTFDLNRFDPRLRRARLTETSAEAPPKADAADQGEQIAQPIGGKLEYRCEDATVPGVYRFDLTAKSGSENSAGEVLAFAVNVDTAAEGDLRRASRDELAAAAPGMQLHTPGSGLANILKDRKSDLSESPWFFLLLLLILVAEQALAVHLSFHKTESTATPHRMSLPTGTA